MNILTENIESTEMFVNRQNIIQDISNISSSESNNPCFYTSNADDIQSGTKTPPPFSQSDDGYSPTANLKMLVSVISPEIRSRDSNEISEWADEYLEERSQSQQCLSINKGSKKDYDSLYYIRSSKSLNLLCQKFLSLYPEYPNYKIVVLIDEVALRLNVERRRIYDIINILESLNMVTKLGKNKYEWHGRNYLIACLNKLQEFGIKSHCDNENKENQSPYIHHNCEDTILEDNINKAQNNRLSLGVLSQKFLIGLLSSNSLMMYMDEMAKIIDDEEAFNEIQSNPDFDRKKPKTRVRRLYDIANVLSSLKLIEKIRVQAMNGNKKPAFRYVGPDIMSNKNPLDTLWPDVKIVKNNSPINTRHSLFKHSSFSVLTPISAEKMKNDTFAIFTTPTSTTATKLFVKKEGELQGTPSTKEINTNSNDLMLDKFYYYSTPSTTTNCSTLSTSHTTAMDFASPSFVVTEKKSGLYDSFLPLTPLTGGNNTRVALQVVTPDENLTLKRKVSMGIRKCMTTNKRLFTSMQDVTTTFGDAGEVGRANYSPIPIVNGLPGLDQLTNDLSLDKGTQTTPHKEDHGNGSSDTLFQLLGYPRANLGMPNVSCISQAPGLPLLRLNKSLTMKSVTTAASQRPDRIPPPTPLIPTLQFSMPSVLKILNISPINVTNCGNKSFKKIFPTYNNNSSIAKFMNFSTTQTSGILPLPNVPKLSFEQKAGKNVSSSTYSAI